MNSNQIFKNWGLNIQNAGYLPEYLIGILPSKCYFIDSLPLHVDSVNAIKFDQVEETLIEQSHKKILNIATKLWLYNDVYFESDLFYHDKTLKKIQKIIPEKCKTFHEILAASPPKKNISIFDLNQLDFIIELAQKDIIDITLFFYQYQTMIIPTWSCYFMFINNCNNINVIEKIVNVEGMYLRNARDS